MSIADIISSLCRFLGRWTCSYKEESLSIFCLFQVFGIQFGDIASLLATFSLSLNLLWLIYFRFPMTRVSLVALLYLSFILILSLTFAATSLLIGGYKNTIFGCSVMDKSILVPYLIILWSVLVGNVTIYLLVGWRVWRVQGEEEGESRRSAAERASQFRVQYVRTASCFIMAFVFTWTAFTLHRIFQMSSLNISFALLFFDAFCTPLRGFTNCLAYILTFSLFTHYRPTLAGHLSPTQSAHPPPAPPQPHSVNSSLPLLQSNHLPARLATPSPSETPHLNRTSSFVSTLNRNIDIEPGLPPLPPLLLHQPVHPNRLSPLDSDSADARHSSVLSSSGTEDEYTSVPIVVLAPLRV
ncbi:uncharacterized protein VTP21DRAFT_10868 [Calcarisporiella thermophila]|uniref:uncharacterized protein n=1 Tax=Calcarisporiella thermophila TaxID=911321 RepID=UPI0037436758